MSFTGHLDKTITISREVAGASDGMGGTAASTWAVIYVRVPAAIVIIDKREQIIQYDKKSVFADFYWYLEPLSAVREGNRISWDGRTFEVKLKMAWQENARFMKLACVEISRAT